MPNSTRWSSGSVPCRFEWRPSRWAVSALGLLTLLAALSVLASNLPAMVAWPLTGVVLVHGLWLGRREWRRHPREVVIRDGVVEVDGVRVADFHVRWRGVLAFAQWRDDNGKVQRLVWWPDQLVAAERRELRLAAAVETLPREAASMAP